MLAIVLAPCLLGASLAHSSEKSKQAAVDAAHAPEIAAARTAAESWLKALDDERYAECWKQSSSFFQAHVTQEAWERRMDAVRKPDDPVLTHDLNTADYRTELSGLPRGVYVVFVWETVVRSGQATLESVIMTPDSESGHASSWKMIGYAIQQ